GGERERERERERGRERERERENRDTPAPLSRCVGECGFIYRSVAMIEGARSVGERERERERERGRERERERVIRVTPAPVSRCAGECGILDVPLVMVR